jgi:hypothetical protein
MHFLQMKNQPLKLKSTLKLIIGCDIPHEYIVMDNKNKKKVIREIFIKTFDKNLKIS